MRTSGTPQLRYWDSNVFLAMLLADEQRLPDCLAVVDAAQSGTVQILTSALSLAEVLHLQGGPPLAKEQRQSIARMFRFPFITVANVTRHIAEHARDVYWDFGIRPKDAIHVATAMTHHAYILETYDLKLLRHNLQLGSPPLHITQPGSGLQPMLPLSEPQEPPP